MIDSVLIGQGVYFMSQPRVQKTTSLKPIDHSTNSKSKFCLQFKIFIQWVT